MSVTEQIIQRLNQLSETEQSEVLGFVDYLQTRGRERKQKQDTKQWTEFSLDSAMRGLEEDPVEYSIENIQETFQ